MIPLTRLKGTVFYVNPDLIETVEATPDTVITLTNGHKYLIEEGPQEVSDRMRQRFTTEGCTRTRSRRALWLLGRTHATRAGPVGRESL